MKDKEDGIIINDEFYTLPDFSFSPLPPEPEELIDNESSPPPPPSSQIYVNYNPRKDVPRRKSEEERKMWKEEEEEKKETNIFSNSNFSAMMEQMCNYLEKKYKLTEGLFSDLLKIFFTFILEKKEKEEGLHFFIYFIYLFIFFK
jgi:hypothetical protein